MFLARAYQLGVSGVVLNRVFPKVWALAAAAVFCLGMFIAVAIVGDAAGSAGTPLSGQSDQRSDPIILHISPGAAAFGVVDGAFYSASSLFVPLAMAEIDEAELAAHDIDLESARHAAVVIDSLNTALAQAGFKTHRAYATAVAAGRRAPHEAVDRAYPAAAALSARDCMNLRRALDHLALSGKTQEARDLMETGRRPDPWKAASETFSRALDEAL